MLVSGELTARSTLSAYNLDIDLPSELADLDKMNPDELKQARKKMQQAYDQLVAKERKYKSLYSARSTARSDVTFVDACTQTHAWFLFSQSHVVLP